MKSLKLGKNALILSATTLVTTLVWIGFDIYRVAHETTITKITQEQMLPLDPEINTATIETLKNSLSFDEQELDFISPTPSHEKN